MNYEPTKLTNVVYATFTARGRRLTRKTKIYAGPDFESTALNWLEHEYAFVRQDKVYGDFSNAAFEMFSCEFNLNRITDADGQFIASDRIFFRQLASGHMQDGEPVIISKPTEEVPEV